MCVCVGGGGGGGQIPYEKDEVLSMPFMCHKAVFISFRVLSLKGSTLAAFEIPFKVLRQKRNMAGENELL